MKAFFSRRTAEKGQTPSSQKSTTTTTTSSSSSRTPRKRTLSTPPISLFAAIIGGNPKSNTKSRDPYYEPRDVSYPMTSSPDTTLQSQGVVTRGASRNRKGKSPQKEASIEPSTIAFTTSAGVGNAPISSSTPSPDPRQGGGGGGGGGGGAASTRGTVAGERSKSKSKSRYEAWRDSRMFSMVNREDEPKDTEATIGKSTPLKRNASKSKMTSRIGNAWMEATGGSSTKTKQDEELPSDLAAVPRQKASTEAHTQASYAPLYMVNASGTSKVNDDPTLVAHEQRIAMNSDSNEHLKVPGTHSQRTQATQATNGLQDRQASTSNLSLSSKKGQQNGDAPTIGPVAGRSLLVPLQISNGVSEYAPTTPVPSEPDQTPKPPDNAGNVWGRETVKSPSLEGVSRNSSLNRAPSAFKMGKGKWANIPRSKVEHPGIPSSDDRSFVSDRSSGTKGNRTTTSVQDRPPLSASASLAHELNDLAVAYDEGLLGEEEYRLLRQGAFNRTMSQGAMEVPSEGNVRGLGMMSVDERKTIRSKGEQNVGASTDPMSRSLNGSVKPSTLHSQRSSVLSIFRRSSAPRLDVDQAIPHSGSSILSSEHHLPSSSSSRDYYDNARGSFHGRGAMTGSMNGSGSSLLIPSNGSIGARGNRSMASTSQYSGTSGHTGGTRSLSNLRRGNSRREKEKAEELERQYMVARRARSFRGAAGAILDPSSIDSSASSVGAGDRKSVVSAAGLSVSSGNALLGVNYAQKSSAEIKAERATIEAEFKRLAESFVSLEQTTMGRYAGLDHSQLKRAWAGSSLNRGGKMDVEDESGFVFVGNEGDAENLSSDSNGKKRPFGPFGGKSVRKASSGPMDTSSRSRIGTHLSPPSSFRGTSNEAPSPDLSPSLDGLSNQDKAGNDTEESEKLIAQLTLELDEVARRRDQVTIKYQERLDFLKSATRSALIREGLR